MTETWPFEERAGLFAQFFAVFCTGSPNKEWSDGTAAGVIAELFTSRG